MHPPETIPLGIDLGTTNSAAALNDGRSLQATVVKNGARTDTTPSALWEDKSGTMRVGSLAKQRLEADPHNAWSEFKTSMGKTGPKTEKTFRRSGRRMTNVEASAEVLKALRADVQRETGEAMAWAVITVPAAFDLPACDATKRAADLAGFKQVVLLPEPTAAALAYLEHFQGTQGFWLVFDFGGGTFDAAVVRLNEGGYDFVAHAGDNELGGKLIDWAIVNELFIPALAKRYRLTDFRRGNEKWLLPIAKLKDAAESAKIQTTTHESVDIPPFDLGEADEAGERMEFEFTLTRTDVNRICESYLRRAVEKSREALRDAKLRPQDVTSVLLVGGPTLMPFFRESLVEPKKPEFCLGIPLDHSQDPLTVVALGAAKFARQQRILDGGGEPPPRGVATLTLNYKPVGVETDPQVNGRLVADGVADCTGYSIEFTNTTMRPTCSTGKIGLSPEGAFFCKLEAEKGPENVFKIEVFDPQGGLVKVTPDRMTYLVGRPPGEEHVINSLGLATMGNRYSRMVEKGVPLPARKRRKFRTAFELRAGQPNPPIATILEGEHRRADRNHVVLEINLKPADITRDLPAGTDVDVTIELDESRILRAKVFIGELDREFEGVVDFSKYGRDADSPAGLREAYKKQKERLEKARKQAREMGVAKAERLLLKLDADRVVPEIETNLASADDHNAATQCAGRIKALTVALDHIEDVLAWPAKIQQVQKDLGFWKEKFTDARFNATAQEKADFARYERQLAEIIAADNPEDVGKLADLHEAAEDLGFSVWVRTSEYWMARFFALVKRKAEMKDQQKAEAYDQQGQRAIRNEDWESLRSAVMQLQGLIIVIIEPRQVVLTDH
jgi:molecular chaperone DnaK